MKYLFIFIILSLYGHIAFSQTDLPPAGDTSRISITLKDGSVYSGKIIDRNASEIMFSTEDQVITILRANIQKIGEASGSRRVRVIMNDDKEYRGVLLMENDKVVIIQNPNVKLTLSSEKIIRIEDDFEKKRVRIVMKDGTRYEGYQNADEKNPNVIYTDQGKVEYNSEQVKKITSLNPTSQFGFENPIPTKYFLGPSAIPLKKGTSYYNNQAVIFNSVQTGVSNNISIGGGLEFLSLFVSGSPLLYGNIKISASASDRFHYGGGLITGGVLGFNDFGIEFFVAPYGIITVGNYDHNLTFGGGVVLESYPFGVFTLSGMTRVSRKVSLISNNYFAIGESIGGLPSFGIQGVRIMGETTAFDIGLILNRELLSDGVILPYAGFFQRF